MSDDVLDEIQPIKYIDHIPLFYADKVNTMTEIEAAGYRIYYILASEKVEIKGQNNVITNTFTPGIWRVDATVIGRSITAADPTKDLHLFCETSESATYTLPKMPWEFTRKIDAFFRKAFEVYGTESILILTYDETYLGSENPADGWGCITPKQDNTAMDCHYEMDSVMQVKPEHVTIVGTWHSHPEMSAFFSHTDHKDQDDWDGIHLTTGWAKNGPSEWHIALILNGHNWILKPEQVFANPPVPETDVSEVDEWMKNVEKKSYAQGTTTYGTSHYGTTPGGTTSHGYLPNKTFPTPISTVKLPEDAPDPTKTMIVARVDWTNVLMQCPFCKVPVSKTQVHEHRCGRCSSFYISIDETLEDLLDERRENSKPYVLDLDPAHAPKPIVYWEITSTTNSGTFSDDLRTIDAPK